MRWPSMIGSRPQLRGAGSESHRRPSVLFLTLGPAAQGLHPVEAVLELFINTVRRLSEFCGVLSALALAAAVLVVCHMVVMRYVLGESTIWQTEFTIYSLVGATLIGSPYVLLRRGHVNVDLLPLYLPPRARLVLAFVPSLLGLAFCLVLAITEESRAGKE